MILGASSLPVAVAAFPDGARKTTAARTADPMQIVRIDFMTGLQSFSQHYDVSMTRCGGESADISPRHGLLIVVPRRSMYAFTT
jgi:hypothetical protein